MPSKLDQLRAMTVVVADTGDIEAVRRLKPQDCTTNPTLLLKAVEIPAYGHFLDEALHWGRRQGGAREAVAAAVCDRLAVAFGAELAGIVPGRVSTEVDADLSFDTAGTVDKARAVIAAYAERGVPREKHPHQDRLHLGGHPRGGSPAARGHRLQPDAAVLARRRRRPAPTRARSSSRPSSAASSTGTSRPAAGPTRARPIPASSRSGASTPAYKAHGVGTVVMGASFRNAGEIEALAGCDRLTISPALLDELANDRGRSAAPALGRRGRRRARPGSASTRRPSASSSTRTRWRPRSCRRASGSSLRTCGLCGRSWRGEWRRGRPREPPAGSGHMST